VFNPNRAAFLALSAAAIFSSAGAIAAPPAAVSVAELLAILNSPDSSANDRAQACQDLGAFGAEEAVPTLAKLLDDPKFSHYARYGLQPNPSPAAGEALLRATNRLQGDLLVGVVNSLGARKELAAVPRLVELVNDTDSSVAVAAAGALAEIASDEPLEGLRSLPFDQRVELVDPLIECADRHIDGGSREQAAALLRRIVSSSVPNHLRRSALIRLVDAAPQQEALDLIEEQLSADQGWRFEAGVQCAVRSPDPAAAQLLAAVVAASSSQRQLRLLAALESRGDRTAADAVRKAANSRNPAVRAAAIGALGTLGNGSDIERLVAASLDDDVQIRSSAFASLGAVEGEDVEKRLLNLLDNPDSFTRKIATQVTGRRRMDAAGTQLLALASSDNSPEVRLAALEALSRIAPPALLPNLLDLATKEKSTREHKAAKNAVLATALRVSDRSQSAELVASRIQDSPSAQHVFLFDALLAIAGDRALELVTDAALSPTQSLQDEATRVLGDWPTRDAAPVLLSIADGAHPYRVRALRGYLRIVRQFDFSDAKRVEMVGKALPLADRDPERLLALAILEKHPSRSSLKLAQQQLDISLLGDKASPFVVAIAEQVVDEHPSAAAAAAQAVLQAGGEESIRARARRLASKTGTGP
jgi:HEAT repeat protein